MKNRLTHLAVAAIFLFVAVNGQLECTAYLSSAEGLFKIPFYMESRYENSVITNVSLLERHSYYTCEPHDEKYGKEPNGDRWWVFRGCGGLFEVEECSKDISIPLRLKDSSKIPQEQQAMEKKTLQEFGATAPSGPQTGDFRGTDSPA